MEKAKMMDIEDEMIANLKTGDFEGLMKIGMEYSDAVIKASDDLNEELTRLFKDIDEKDKRVNTIEKGENFTESYFELYNELIG